MRPSLTKNIAMCALAFVLVPSLAALQGCSSQETRTTVTRTTSEPATDGAYAREYANSGGSTVITTTTTESERPDSVLGATAHAAWTAVALPFRVVADTLGLIL